MTWLNTEVDLSKKITNMEKDFSNGYLLGELLHKFNQLTNLDSFQDRNDREAMVNNFRILHDVLRNVGVKFDTNTATSIMHQKKGVIANLLYEIRSNLEKKGVNPENISLKKSSHFQEMYAPMKFRQEIPPYDAFDSKHFIDTLQRKVRSQKEVDLENKLKRFEDFKQEQNRRIEQAKLDEELRKKQELDINIKNHRNKNQRYHAFLQQFEEKGINNWKNNMLRGKQREMKDIQFQLDEANKIQRNLQRGINNNIAIYKREVNQFEENFGKNGKKKNLLNKDKINEENKEDLNTNEIANANITNDINENALPLSSGPIGGSSLPHYPDVDARAEAIKDKIFQKIMVDNRTKTERNRRRRKIIVEQSKAQLEIENRRREEQYISKLAKQSNQEKQLTYETYRVNQCKNIIRENRNLREEMYKKRQEQNIEFEKINQENFLKFHQENFKRDMDKEDGRKKDLEISQKQKKRNLNSDICEKMINLIIDISDKSYEYQQINDVEEIDPRVWREWTNLFINNESVLYKEPEVDQISEIHNNEENEEEEEKKEEEEEYKEEEEKEKDKDKESEKEKEKEVPPKSNKGTKLTGEHEIIHEHDDEHEEHDNDEIPHEGQEDEDMDINIESDYGKTFFEALNGGNAQCTKIDKLLDKDEFTEYTENKGQWDPSLIPEEAFITLTADDLVFNYNPPANNVDPKKDPKAKNPPPAKGADKGKGGGDNIEDLIKESDPEDLVIPKENVKNTLFGDLIDILIDIKYEEEAKKIKEEKEAFKNVFRYVPIKISIIGQDFSGKKTQAKILSQNFPLKIYDLGELVKDALSYISNKRDTKTNFLLSGPLAKSNLSIGSKDGSDNKNSTIVKMRNEQAEEDKKYAKIKELASEIVKRLLQGNAISDDIYADLLYEYIKKDFPPKEDYEVAREIIERVERIEDIKEEIQKNIEQNSNRPKAFEKKDKELNDELMKISLEASKGFVVVNYPKTYNQAKILESKLSGYISEAESPELKSTKLKEVFKIVLDKSEKINPPFQLLKGGFDFIFYLNVPGNECIRRAVGRRVYRDPKTNEKIVYHLEDNLPPITGNTCEKLEKINDTDHSESSLVTRHLAFENSINQVVNFYQPFGFEKINLKSFEIIDGNRERDYVTQDILSYVNQLVELNEQHDQEVFENQEEEEFEEEEENPDGNILDGIDGDLNEGEIKKEEEEKKEEEKKEEKKKRRKKRN